MPTRIDLDRSGTMRNDLFYIIQVSTTNDELTEPARQKLLRDGWVLSLRDNRDLAQQLRENPKWLLPVEYYNASMHMISVRKCKFSPNHETRLLRSFYEVHLQGGMETSDIIPAKYETEFIISESMMKALMQLPLRGADIRSLPIGINETDVKEIRLYGWQFMGDSCSRPHTLHDGPNKCPFCDYGPIVCPQCGIEATCARCKKPLYFAQQLAKPGEKRILFDMTKRNDEIIEGCRWDGTDCFRSHFNYVISYRLFDWLIKRHSTSFIAKSIPICVDGMSDEQLEWLEIIKKPFE